MAIMKQCVVCGKNFDRGYRASASSLTCSKVCWKTHRAMLLVGRRFGRLTVESGAYVDGNLTWTSRCDCGNLATHESYRLLRGESRSCGCLIREYLLSGLSRSHGRTGTKLYRAWTHIIGRCTNPKTEKYPDYGGRGIKICERWRASFEAFAADVGEPPTPQHTIDRIENDGNYEPGNVRWATWSEQGRNRRNSRLVTHNGKTMSVADWSDATGMSQQTILSRLNRGWPDNRAVSSPLQRRRGGLRKRYCEMTQDEKSRMRAATARWRARKKAAA